MSISEVAETRAAEEWKPEDRGAGGPPSRRLGLPRLVAFAAPAVVTFIALCVRNSYVFSAQIHEDGDPAANSVLIQQAARFRLLFGNYSRVGFHHPGPAFLYVSAAGQTVFHRFLGIAASAYGGQLLATFALNACLVGLVVLVVYRRTRSFPASAVVFGVVALFVSYHESIDSGWFPHLYFMPFLLFMVAGASVAAADLSDLPYFVLAGSLLVHGHISFTEFVAGGTVAVVAVRAWRRRGRLRADLAAQKGRLKASAIVLAVFLLPLVLNVLLHFPGEWGKYVLYLRHNGANTHPIGPAGRFLLSYWAHRRGVGLLFAIFGLAGAAVAWLDRDAVRRRFYLGLLGMGLLMSLLFLAYAVRGVDDLSQGYIGIFYMSVPLVVLVTSAAATATALERLGKALPGAVRSSTGGVESSNSRPAPGGHAPSTGEAPMMGSARRNAGAVALFVVAAGLLVAAWRGPQLANPYRGSPDLSAAVAAVQAAPQRQGRVVALEFPHDMWPEAIGFLVNANRAGLHSCVVDSAWTFMVTGEHICPAADLAKDWHIHVEPAYGPALSGVPVIWSDAQNVITTSP